MISNRALSEALFTLAEREPLGERRVAWLKVGYAAFDATGPARNDVLRASPEWLQPYVSQLVSCRADGALDAVVQRLAGDHRPRHNPSRQRFLAQAEVRSVLDAAPEELSPRRLRGAFHWHTTASDGRGSLESMANVCRRRGATWAVVSDHSKGLEVASGLDPEGVRLQRRKVDRWNQRWGDELRLIQGLEVEILEDGTIDLSADERRDVECVVAAIHRGMRGDRDQTDRLIRAVTTDGVDVLAHPRARLFHHRPGIRARWEKVFAACATAGVAVEINGFPRRQDLDWELTRLAHDAGCWFLVASDAHAPGHLEFDRIACAIAARAEVPAHRILNFRNSDSFEDWLQLRG